MQALGRVASNCWPLALRACPGYRELRVRADAGFGYHPVLEILEARPAQYAVVARLTSGLKCKLGGLRYERADSRWQLAELEYRPQGWPKSRRFVVARQPIEEAEPEPTLFYMARYLYRAWVTNLPLTPAGIGISMMGERAWSLVSANCGRILPCARSPPGGSPLRPLPGSNSSGIQLGDCVPANLPAQRVARPELEHVRYRLLWPPGELRAPSTAPP